MGKEFHIRVLKPVPKKFREDRIFDLDELSAAGLDIVYNTDLNDRYHVPVKSRSVYASMDDVKNYLKKAMPGTDIKNWGMRHIRDVYHCHGTKDDWMYDIPEGVMKTLERPHVSDVHVISCEESWFVDCYDAEYLSERCPMYITKKTINEVIAAYIGHLAGMDEEEVSCEVTGEMKHGPDMISSLCAAHVYAQKAGGIGYIEWE